VHAIGPGRESNVSAGIDEESSSQFPVLSSQLRKDVDRVARELLKFPGGEIFFAKLDEIDSGATSFTDLGEHCATPLLLISRKLAAIRDVVEQASRHRPSLLQRPRT
jgi:hypothetical protein